MKTLFAIIAVLAIAACAGAPSGTTAPTRFEYRVPSPPTGLYHIEDSVVVGLSTPVGDVEVATSTLLTMTMLFGRDPRGVGVVGTVVGFNATSTNSLTGTRIADANDVSGPLSLVLGSRGNADVGTLPSFTGDAEDLSPFPGVAFELFPQLPDHPVAVGGTWVDTVTWTVVAETAETTNTTVYTYTMMGDVVLGGRSLPKIGMEGDVRFESVAGQGDTRSIQEMTGRTTGYVIWDRETNLPALVESRRELEGTNTVPGAGPIRIKVTGSVRITAVFQQEERRREGGRS